MKSDVTAFALQASLSPLRRQQAQQLLLPQPLGPLPLPLPLLAAQQLPVPPLPEAPPHPPLVEARLQHLLVSS